MLHILTGFLGSGKTTFLRQWLDFLHGRERYTGVIQNEFGEIGLDAALLRGETQVEALDEGCVCCSLADSLRPGLLRLIGDMPAEQFILETTGLANPANVMDALSELRDIVQPGLVITVADALDLCRSEGDIAGIRRAQAARADVIVLNKADTVEPAALEALAERLRALNRQALILPARHGAIAFAELDAFYADWADRRGTPLPSHRPALPRFGETVTHADEGFVSAALRLSAPLDEAALLALLDSAGPGLCRAKGVVDLRLDGGVTVPATVQYAAGRLGFEPAPEGVHRHGYFPAGSAVFVKEELVGLIELGGWMMWPLLAVSVAALAIVVERALVFMGCPFPDSRFPGLVLEAMRTGDVRPLAARLEAVPSLRDFAALLGSPLPNREAALRLAGETVLERLETRLSLLSVLARLAPLMGLLGTILGMITTFSRIAEARSGVDMSLLAGGIWQALLTTAAGLCIAIPALFFLSCFQGKVRRVADALNKAGNAALLADGGRGLTVRAGAEPIQPGDIPRGGGTARPTPEGTADGASCPESPKPRGSVPEGREAPQCRDNAGEGLPDGGRSC